MKNIILLAKSNLEFIRNYCFAFLAVILQIGTIQLIILPQVSRIMNNEDYGLMLTLISVVDIIAITLGATLCNVRLISLSEYKDKGLNGDYNIYCVFYASISAILTMIISLFYIKKFSFHIIFIGIMAATAFLFSYSQVSIRLNKKFHYDLISSLLLSLGFLMGYLLYRVTNLWPLIYISGYSFGSVFCGIIVGKFYQEPIYITSQFNKTNKKIIELGSSSFIKQLTTYADRLILYPILGGKLVAIYYAATLVGKVVSLASTPLNSLFLSYIDKPKDNIKQYLTKIILYSLIFSFFLYWICLLCSRPILFILYPQYYESAMSIIYLTVFSAMIEVVISIITPFTLKLFDTSLQIIISIISTSIYFCSTLILLTNYKLLGFCIAIILSSIAKLVVIIFATIIYGK